jgi:hypothetical protein
MVAGIDPETGQPTDGFGLIIEPESGVSRPYRQQPLTRGTEELAPESADSLSTRPPADSGRNKEDNPYFVKNE